MVNLGNATAKDVRELITIAQQAVEKKFNLHLEVEISFVGEFNYLVWTAVSVASAHISNARSSSTFNSSSSPPSFVERSVPSRVR